LVDWHIDLLRGCSRSLLRFDLNDGVDDLTFAEDGIEFPVLRELHLDIDELPEGLPEFVAGLKAPDLCTLVLTGRDFVPRRAATVRALARLEGVPHLSLVVAVTWYSSHRWVLGDGQATPVARGVIPLDEDWWLPAPAGGR